MTAPMMDDVLKRIKKSAMKYYYGSQYIENK
jgi:hypothetical protein